MEQETHFNENNSELISQNNERGFDYETLSDEEKSRMVTLSSGKKVILTSDNRKAFDPTTGLIIDVSPDDII